LTGKSIADKKGLFYLKSQIISLFLFENGSYRYDFRQLWRI